MITTEQKTEIGRLVVLLAHDLGWQKTAARLGVNQVTARYNVTDPEKWPLVSDKMWVRIGEKLGYKFTESAWHLTQTTNTRIMCELLDRAQNEQLFMAISHPAGEGKSTGVMLYRLEHEAVFYIECEESWSHRQFVWKMAETLGVQTLRSNISLLTDEIVAFLKQKASRTRPLLIVDEANKLKPSSLRLFIPLFNKLQDEVGMVLIGAHDLKRHIQAGVRRDSRGFDELESRLGRSYMQLAGIFEGDVRNICAANGVADGAVQQRIWQRMKPIRKEFGGRYEWVASQDLRVLKQAVKHERLRLVESVTEGREPRPITEMEADMGAKLELVDA